jgi:2-phosphosulfolactate phosphatase
MDIKILHWIEGAREAHGLTAIIDVFRAFSVACYVYGNGASRIMPVGTLEDAYALKKDHPEYLLIGERRGMKPEGFDYGNSPAEIENVDFSGKNVVQTTSAGIQGIVNAVNADEIITGAFVNAQAIIEYIRMRNPKEVSLVCMGWAGKEAAEEDELCAEYIKNVLESKPCDFSKIVHQLRDSRAGKTFFDPAITWKPERDFDLCLSLNKFNFVLKTESDDAGLYFRKINI